MSKKTKDHKSTYARKRDYLKKLSKRAGRRVWGFEIPMARKIWRKK